MIRNGIHHVTGITAIVVTCDTPDCPEATYLTNELTIYTGGLHMRAVGWDIANSDRLTNGGLPAHCPTHATQAAPPCPHDYRERVMLDRRETCRHCGQAVRRTGVA